MLNGCTIMLFIYLCLVVSGITATVLYSELFRNLREMWFCFFDKSKFLYINKLKYLSVCSLCLGFWISNFIQWYIIPFSTIYIYVLNSFGCCFIVWLLCCFVLMCDSIKAYFNQRYNIEEKEI